MQKTLVTTITDAAIARNCLSEFRQIRDEKRNVVMRYHQSGKTGSWFVVRYAGGKTLWRKVGGWPAITSKTLFARLAQLNAQMAVNDHAENLRVGQMHNVAQVAAWYLNRVKQDKNITVQRRSSIRTAIRKHITPRLGLVRLDKLDRAKVDKDFLWPLQGDYAVATVRSIFAVLKAALKQAEKLGLIERDPMAGMKFTDFITAPIREKGTRLRPFQVEPLLQSLVHTNKRTQFLVLMMLMYGTRINETLLAKKSHFSFTDGIWHIPEAHTKTRQAHELPITEPAARVIRYFLSDIKGRCLFPSNHNKPLCRSSASQAIRELSGGAWSAHDLRKVARTRWQDQDADYFVAKMMLNHALPKLDKAYIHTHATTLIRKEFEVYHLWLLERGLHIFCK